MTNLIQKVHNSPYKMVLAVTGGGTSAISELLSVPGASNSIIEAIVPYHPHSLRRFLGFTPDQNCSARTARSMAMASYKKARRLCKESDPSTILGLGCTAALSTDRERRGDNRVHLAIQSSRETREFVIRFDKGKSDRQQEEVMATAFILHNIADACDIDINPDMKNQKPGLNQESSITQVPPSWLALLEDKLVTTLTETGTQLIFPGAFDPLHDGHRQMIRFAESRLNLKAVLEISIVNVDKRPLDFVDMKIHAQNLAQDYPLAFTNAPTFAEKSFLFPKSTFIVGTDTIRRIADSQYYASPEKLDLALNIMGQHETRFLVFGRDSGSGFEGLGDIDLPSQLSALCTAVPESEFRIDLSSTQLRQPNK